MDDDAQQVHIGRRAQQQEAGERPGRDVDVAPSIAGHLGKQRGLVGLPLRRYPVRHRQRQVRRGHRDLAGHAAAGFEHGAQHLVPGEDLLQAAAQRGHVERPAQA